MNPVKRSILISSVLVLAVAQFGCTSNQARRQHIPSEVTTNKPTEGRPTLGMPIFLPMSDVSVVPFTIDRPRRWLEDSDRFEAEAMSKSTSTRSAAYASNDTFGGVGLSRSVRWHNAVIQPKEGKGQLALDRRGLISRFEVVGQWVEDEKKDKDDETTYTFVPKAVLMLATTQDTDGDQQLTSSDANVLLAADQNGAGLHAITPAGTQVISLSYNATRNLILIMVASDRNGDGLFSEADSAAPYLYTPGTEGIAKPLVDPLRVEQAERLLK